MCDDMTAGMVNKNTGIRDRQMVSTRRQVFRDEVRDGIPIALGCLAVFFTLGITIQEAGMTTFQGMLTSLLNSASAGEYIGFALITAGTSHWEVALLTLITNARYLLMSCALSQKFAPDAPLIHRLLVGRDVTDEIFGISIVRPGYLNPYYNYDAIAVVMSGRALGTWLGAAVGNVLPLRAASALNVALYDMFLAVTIPSARNDRVVAGLVLLSFVASFPSVHLPTLTGIFGGTRTILLTVVTAGAAVVLFPIDRDEISSKRVQ